MGDVLALSGTLQKPAVLRLMAALSRALDDMQPGELSVAEAIGCLEICKMQLYRDLTQFEE